MLCFFSPQATFPIHESDLQLSRFLAESSGSSRCKSFQGNAVGERKRPGGSPDQAGDGSNGASIRSPVSRRQNLEKLVLPTCTSLEKRRDSASGPTRNRTWSLLLGKPIWSGFLFRNACGRYRARTHEPNEKQGLRMGLRCAGCKVCTHEPLAPPPRCA